MIRPPSESQIRPRSTVRGLYALAATALVLGFSQASTLAYVNVLNNPSWELGNFSGWVDTYNASHSVDNTSGWVYGSGNTIHEPAHTGTWALKTWGDYWGFFVQDHWVSQYIPAAASSRWSGDVWVRTATPDNIKGQNFGRLEISFCDSTSNLISGEIYYSDIITTNTPVDSWIHLVATNSLDGSTNLVAPVGTAFVRFALLYEQDATQAGGSTYWDDANLIKTASTDPEIAQPPQDQSVIYGQTANFTVIASGNTPLTYTWYKDSVLINDGGRISGATTAHLVISNVTTLDQGAYSVTVHDNAGTLPSPSSGYLTVVDPGILTQPASLVKIEGQSATFTVVPAGSGTLNYTWYRGIATPVNNGGRISGANTASLTIANLIPSDSDAYYVIVAGPSSQMTSSNANLIVKPLAEAANLMLNSGFEDPTPMNYWTHWNNAGIVQLPPGTDETNYDGTQICEISGSGAGTWNGCNQSFPATGGNIYSANAWFLHSSGVPIDDNAEGWLEINFYIAGNLMTSTQTAHVTSNTMMGVWTNLAIPYAVAPAGADEVRCQINYHAGANGGGAIFLDDVSFYMKLPVTVTIGGTPGNIQLSFPTQTGTSYEIYYKDDLSEATWQPLHSLTGDLTGQASWTDTTSTGARRFYLVQTM